MKKLTAGFTLLELAIVVGIIGILAAVALVGYQSYTEKAASTELIEQYDELRERAALAVSEGANLCDDPEKVLSPNSVLYNPHAELSIVKADPDIIGLQIKADVAGEGAHNTAIARAAHDTLNRNNQVIAGAVVNESVVSFTALLANTPCADAGQSASTSTAAPVAAIQPGSQATAGSSSSACPNGQEEVAGQCVPWCASDEARNANGVCEALPDPNQLIQALSPEKQAALAALPKDMTSDPTIVATPADVPPPPTHWEAVTGAQAQQVAGPNQCEKPTVPITGTGNDYETPGAECSIDFGDLCGECYVQAMCQSYCGWYKPDAEMAAAIRANHIVAVQRRCQRDRDERRDNGWCRYLDDLVAGRRQ
jgi:prepilin-type N-terminal cleavage/methylation domain-containing protein